jgi:L-rhamnose isomerase/sugar isomerase
LVESGIDVDAVEARLKAQRVETPSWGYADSGTRFGTFRQPGAASTVREKLADAAQAHRYTGIAPAVALHIPWDKVDDWADLADYGRSLGIEIGAINPNVFQDHDYRFGSLASERANVRKKALDHMSECVSIMRTVGSKALSLWFADGTNFPGQADFRERKRRFEEGLGQVHSLLHDDETMLVEYKPFEPASYHTDIADWGMAYALCHKAGAKARVLVDLGHHLHGANIEHIVAFLVDEGRLGGFHFNNRKYADDDLTTGSINPYELFLIYTELVKAERTGGGDGIAYMIDESHTLKNKVAEMIQSLVALQASYAKALLVDWDALAKAQAAEDLIGAEEIYKTAFAIDVRPLLWKVRTDLGLPNPIDPVRGFRESGYAEKAASERVDGGVSQLGA